VLLDAYQATGQLPTNVRELGVDAYVTGGLKWLLGGPGVAFLYVRRELHAELHPALAGWFGHQDQFAFDSASFRPHLNARKFEMGTPATAAVYAASAGLDLILEATPEDERERAGIVMVRLADPAAAVKALAAEGIIVDHRPGRVRVSPYFYNTELEVERFVDAIRRVAPP